MTGNDDNGGTPATAVMTNSIAITPAPAQTNANNNGNDGSNSHPTRNRRMNSQPNQVQLTNPITFEGDTPEIGCVIGMRHNCRCYFNFDFIAFIIELGSDKQS